MPVYEAVLFDYGGVFTASPFGAVASFADKLGADPDQLVEIVFGSYETDTDHPWHRLERGEVTAGEAFESIVEIGRQAGIVANPVEFFLSMGRSGIRNEVVDCARGLRADGIKTALVTNNAKEFSRHWRATLPLDDLFDVVVDSSEEGVRKPNPAIFELTLERLGGVAPASSAFLDDHPGNIAAAEGVGIRGVLVEDDPTGALAELARLVAGGR